MNRNVKLYLAIAAVALVLALPITLGCDSSSSGNLVQNPITATFTADGAPVDNSVSLQAGGAGASSDTFKVNVVVGAVDGINGIDIKVHFNQFFTAFVSGDFTGSFLQGALPAAEFDTHASLFGAGVVDVAAARRGAATTGITMAAGDTGTLCTLTFKAIAATTGQAMSIDDTDILVTVCPAAGGACTTQAVTLGGGGMTAQ